MLYFRGGSFGTTDVEEQSLAAKESEPKRQDCKVNKSDTPFLASVPHVGIHELLSSKCLDIRGQILCSLPQFFFLE